MRRRLVWLACALFLGEAVVAQDRSPPPDILSCLLAVDTLDDDLRGPMQTHCLEVSRARCEAGNTGPILQCLGRLQDDLSAFIDTHRRALPETIAGHGLAQRRYARIRAELSDVPAALAECAGERAFDTSRCKTIILFSLSTRLLNAARLAGVTLR